MVKAKQEVNLEGITFSTEDMLRVASVNFLADEIDVESRAKELAEQLQYAEIDVLHLQEVPRNSDSFNTVRFLKEALDMSSGFIGATVRSKHTGNIFANATLVRNENVEFDTVHINNVDGSKYPYPGFVTSKFRFNDKDIITINVHLNWGASHEWVRVKQAEAVARFTNSRLASTPDAVVILTGDLNTVPESSTIRFLTGLQEGSNLKGTKWVDAWEEHGTEENSITSDASSKYGVVTADLVGLFRPTLVPKRRIDYIMTHGWNYGQNGYPLTFQRFADGINGIPISDHYGILSDILVELHS